MSFVAGLLVGAVLGGVTGLGGAAYVLYRHPNALQRIKSLLSSQPANAVALGDLNDVVVTVDGGAAGRPISPYIYGVAGADPSQLEALGATLDRWGGNNSSRYNWANGHAWNAARDWDFRNGNYGHPSGSAADQFITGTRSASAAALLTIPTLGWVAKNDDNSTQSTGVPNGNGGPPASTGSSAIAGYDPTANQQRTSVPSFPRKPGPLSDPPSTSGPVYQNEWVHHLVDTFGPAPRGVAFYAMDNEPDLWSVTQEDVHPVQMSYDDMLANFETYATAVKEQDPQASVLGPDVSGWTAYFYSARDRGSDNFATHADRSAHGGEAFLPWWLSQVAAADRARGSRSLDYLDVHYYPQAANVYSDASDPATQALRIRSVRSLFDPNYTDESWIGTQVQLVPRLKQWIAQDYPGTKLAITEYSWGGSKDPSGGVAEAEALGIFGREGVDLASYWYDPDPASSVGRAIRMYRNYDGKGGTFGDLSVGAASNQRGVMAFAARQSSRKELDLMLVNESPNQVATVHLKTGVPGSPGVTAYQASGQGGQISPVNMSIDSPIQLPPYSTTLVRVAG